jgi:glycosyltransferase involved in cell wall biosynthesis
MKVALDTNSIYTSSAGVARYVRGVAQGLATSVTSPDEIFHFAWQHHKPQSNGWRRAANTVYREWVWARLIAPGLLRRMKPDVYHATGSALLTPPQPIPFVATVHDLAAVRTPSRYRPWHRRQLKGRLRRLLQADRFICISRFTADELMELLGIPAAKIAVVYNGIDDLTMLNQSNRLPPGFEIPAHFFLFVGSLEPGKNLELLRRVYELAESRGVSLPPLLIVGARWLGVAGEGAAPRNWHYLGWIPDEILVVLYRRAQALLFPSRYEGFGLPVAEAMSLGCPVVCSSIASLPEVAGDAAYYAAQTPEAYLAAIRTIMTDESRRDAQVRKGREQASKFTWKECAEGCLEAYRKVVRSSGG